MTGQLEIEIHFHFHIFDTCNLTLSSCAVGATWNSMSFSLSHLSNLYFHFIFLCWRSYLKFTLPLLWPHFLIWTLILSFSASSSSLSSYLSPYHHHHICHPHNYCLLSLLTIHIIFRILIPCIVFILAATIISQVWWAHRSPSQDSSISGQSWDSPLSVSKILKYFLASVIPLFFDYAMKKAVRRLCSWWILVLLLNVPLFLSLYFSLVGNS